MPVFFLTETSGRHKSHQVSQGKVLVTVGLNLLITLVEFAGGILSNSLALVSDALHNLSDTFAISYIALITNKVREELEEILIRKFGIDHVTIQVEYQACHDKNSISDS